MFWPGCVNCWRQTFPLADTSDLDCERADPASSLQVRSGLPAPGGLLMTMTDDPSVLLHPRGNYNCSSQSFGNAIIFRQFLSFSFSFILISLALFLLEQQFSIWAAHSNHPWKLPKCCLCFGQGLTLPRMLYVDKVVFELMRSACLCLLCSGIKGMCHPTQCQSAPKCPLPILGWLNFPSDWAVQTSPSHTSRPPRSGNTA